MYSRLDPLGLCVHHIHITDDQSNPTTSKTCSEVRDLKADIGLGCDNTDYGKRNIMHRSEPVSESVTSSTWLIADGAFEALLINEIPHLPKRTRSCYGRVEASVTDTRCQPPKYSFSRTRAMSFSRARDLCETDVFVHCRDFKTNNISEGPYHEAADPKIKKEDDYKDCEERSDPKAHIKKDSQIIGPGKDGAEPALSSLCVAPTVHLKNGLRVPPAHFIALSRKRKMEVEEEEKEGIVFTLKFKKVKKGTKTAGTLVFAQTIVNPLENSTYRVFSKALSSHFRPSDWLSTDWSPGLIASQHPSYNKHTGFDIPATVSKIDGQSRIQSNTISSTAPSLGGFSRSKVLSYPNTSTGHFVSALHKFNELIPEGDPLGRFNSRPTWCLANINDGSRRCGWSMPRETQQRIRQLFASLAAMEFDRNPRLCVIQLAKLTNLALCHNHRVQVRDRVRLLGPPDSLDNSAQHFAGYSEWLRTARADISQQSGPTMVPVLINKVTYWLREIPTTALHYLPEYLPYRDPKSSYMNVSKWVMNQAEEPLSARKPNELSDGYLYVYWNRASFGVWKIGYTTVDVDSRLKKWETDCNHIAAERYRSPHCLLNAGRVERLVHAELKEYRVFEPACHGCLKSHIEWFKGVDFDVVLECIEFWTQWIMKDQYEWRGGKMCLKREGRNEILQRYTALNGTNARDTKERPLTSSPPRYDLRRRDLRRSTRSSSSREDSSPTKS